MAENTLTGKWQKKHTRKMAEWKIHDMENGRKCMYRKREKLLAQKMTEWKMHDPEIGRTKNAQPGKWQKMHPQ